MQVLPIAYAPSINYMQRLLQTSNLAFELYEYFPKQTFRNHTLISTSNGAMKLSIPLLDRKNKSITKDIRISYSEPWQKLHFKALETAYNSSPFFEYYNYQIEPFYKKKYDFLVDFNLELLNCIAKLMKIDLVYSFTNSYEVIPKDDDLRLHPFTSEHQHEYYQVFADKMGFIKNMGAFDLLFNEGTNAKKYLLGNHT